MGIDQPNNVPELSDDPCHRGDGRHRSPASSPRLFRVPETGRIGPAEAFAADPGRLEMIRPALARWA